MDTGRNHAGAFFGFMNTAANGASALSSIIFGYLVAYSGSYDALFPANAGAAVRGISFVVEGRPDASALQRATAALRRVGRARRSRRTGSGFDSHGLESANCCRSLP